MSGLGVTVDGVAVTVPDAVSVAAALAHAGAGPVGVFCGMGSCYGCLVTVDGRPGVRACLTPVAAGMRIDTRPAPRG